MLQWRHNEHNGVSNYQRLGCLLNCFFRRISKNTPKLRVTGLCEGNSPVTGHFPAQRASDAENGSMTSSWHDIFMLIESGFVNMPRYWVLKWSHRVEYFNVRENSYINTKTELLWWRLLIFRSLFSIKVILKPFESCSYLTDLTTNVKLWWDIQ